VLLFFPTVKTAITFALTLFSLAALMASNRPNRRAFPFLQGRLVFSNVLRELELPEALNAEAQPSQQTDNEESDPAKPKPVVETP
jgi:hypothetical protein